MGAIPIPGFLPCVRTRLTGRPLATVTQNGWMSAADKLNFDAIAAPTWTIDTPSGGNVAVDFTASMHHRITLPVGATTITFSNLPSGRTGIVEVTQPAGVVPGTLTSVYSLPTLSEGGSAVDYLYVFNSGVALVITGNVVDSSVALADIVVNKATIDAALTEYTAGARGLRHITALDWNPTSDAQSHVFAFASSLYSYVEMRIGQFGPSAIIELRPDSVTTNCYSSWWVVGGAGSNGATAYLANNNGVGGGWDCTVSMRPTPGGLWIGRSDHYGLEISTFRMPSWTNLQLYGSSATSFRGNTTKVEVWAIPVV